MKVATFRLQLFKSSEPFIAAQAKALPSAVPVLVGRTMHGTPDPDMAFWRPEKPTRSDTLRFLALGHTHLFQPLLEEQQFSLLHAHFAVDGLYAVALAKRMRVPLITTLHGFDVTTDKADLIRSARPALVRYALLQDTLKREGALFLCVSEFMREEALKAGFPPDRLIVHYMGIDVRQFTPKPVSGPARLVHVARLVEKKGTRYLLEAFAKVSGKYPELTLDVIGEGPLRASLEQLSASLGIDRAVRFHGARPSAVVRDTLSGALALVLPSVKAANGDSEGLGLVLLEAAATAVPAIGTRHGGIPEVVDDGNTGLLVDERDAGGLADAIDALMQDRALRDRLGDQARARAVSDFDVRTQSASLEHLYRKVA